MLFHAEANASYVEENVFRSKAMLLVQKEMPQVRKQMSLVVKQMSLVVKQIPYLISPAANSPGLFIGTPYQLSDSLNRRTHPQYS